jgi:hypothetical protein
MSLQTLIAELKEKHIIHEECKWTDSKHFQKDVFYEVCIAETDKEVDLMVKNCSIIVHKESLNSRLKKIFNVQDYIVSMALNQNT